MTTYNLSNTATIAGNTYTFNSLYPTDLVNMTVSNSAGASFTITTTNCSSNKSSMTSGSTAQLSFSATGNYSAYFYAVTGGKEPEVYTFTISGTVVAAVTQYSITTGTISMDGVRDFLTTASNNSISMNAFYKGGSLVPNISQNSGVPSSGAISLGNLHGVYKNN